MDVAHLSGSLDATIGRALTATEAEDSTLDESWGSRHSYLVSRLHRDRIDSVIEDRRKTILGKQPDLFGFPGADPALQIQRLVAAVRHQAS